jgi:hypothetical protein
MEVDDNSVLIVGDLQGFLDQQLRPHPIQLDIIFCSNYITSYIMKLVKIEEEPFRRNPRCI